MKYLKIEANKVFFIKDKTNSEIWTEIDQIEKTDIFNLLNYMINEDDFEFDEYDESSIANKAHQIIYKHLYEKFSTFSSNKNRFKDEAESLFKDAVEKYQ